MKKFCLLLFLVMLVPANLFAGDSRVNVLGYYAVNNSLDGQPMVDMVNVLRFYPIFAMRDSVDRVSVTIYYGGNIFERNADRMDNSKYWQTLLPIFHLGEAIQRIEVNVHFKLDKQYRSRFEFIRQKEQQWKVKSELNSTQFNEERRKDFGERMNNSNNAFQQFGIMPHEADSLRKVFDKEKIFSYERSSLEGEDLSIVNTLIRERSQLLHGYVQSYESFREMAKEKYEEQKLLLSMELDSVHVDLANDIETNLSDTMYTGTSVRKSDLVIDDSLRCARILYRNYKPALRHLMALDPAERLGIFRVRYVPFPITRTPDKHAVSLRGPFGNEFTVFEVGLAFGDAIVSGDDFVVPEFSWQRLGVAFAITEKLFSDSAQVIALALTYDFNSYGSIGVGGNFAQHEVHPYVSFGINKKAFEAVLSGLTKLFR